MSKFKLVLGGFLEDLEKSKLIIWLLISQACIQVGYYFAYDIDSIKFFPRIISYSFIFFIINSVFFGLTFLILRKKIFKVPLFISASIANFLMYLAQYSENNILEIVNKTFGEFFINKVFNIHFVNVAVNEGNLSWAIALATYVGIFLLIYGQWFIKSKADFDNKIEKQVIFMGVGLYLCLFPLVFVFTHIPFVGTNYVYMTKALQYTEKAVSYYEGKNQKDFFEIEKLKYFKNLDEAIAYYKDPIFKERSEVDNKIGFYKESVKILDKIKKDGFVDEGKINYYDIKRFFEWASFAYNFSFKGVNAETKSAWQTILLRDTDTDIVRHGLFFLRENKEGGVYVLFDYNRTFKNFASNYVFNFFFVLFQFIYLSLLFYLIKIHRKENLKVKKNV